MKHEYVINLKPFLGLNNAFEPHYQFERPFEFGALVKHYMTHYYDAEQQPEKYLHKLECAVKYANKSILLDKLGIHSDQDLEEHNPELFKSTMAEMVKAEPDLYKSAGATTPDLNRCYEMAWKKTFDTLNGKIRT